MRGFPLYAKLEWVNPFGSVKDRAAWELSRDLEGCGKLDNGRCIAGAPIENEVRIAD